MDSKIRIKVADRRDELIQSFRLRYEVFVKEFGVADRKNSKTQLEVDKFDSKSIHIIAVENDQVIGTLRLIPAHDNYDFRGLYRISFVLDGKFFEISRAAIRRDKRGDAKLLYKLLHFALLYAKSQNCKYFCGTLRASFFRRVKMTQLDFIFASEPFLYENKWMIVAFISPLSEMNIRRIALRAE